MYFFFFKLALSPKTFQNFFLVGGVPSVISCLTVRLISDALRRAWCTMGIWLMKKEKQ